MSAPRDTFEAEVVALGGGGDGAVETPTGRVYVPYAAPGDRLRLRLRGSEIVEATRLADGPDRVAPACAHFGDCGGCALQHIEDGAYAAWKRDRVAQALARRGLETEIAPLVRIPPGARRRVRLGARRTRDGVVLGFKARRSHWLVDVNSCPVAVPEIVALLPKLRAVLADCLAQGGTAEVSVTHLDAGLDVAVDTDVPLDLAARERLAGFAEAADLARLGWGGEPVVRRRAPMVEFSGVPVELPPGGFLQPSAAGEAALANVVMETLAEARIVADLHAGCGAFALRLAAMGKTVRAYDVDEAQIAALGDAARDLPVTAETRDLDRRPLDGKELAGLDGVALDPPRAGAAAQARTLAASKAPLIAYVSCNPASFARDARTLVDGGYRLERLVPVDQFLWSPHLELAAVFRR